MCSNRDTYNAKSLIEEVAILYLRNLVSWDRRPLKQGLLSDIMDKEQKQDRDTCFHHCYSLWYWNS